MFDKGMKYTWLWFRHLEIKSVILSEAEHWKHTLSLDYAPTTILKPRAAQGNRGQLPLSLAPLQHLQASPVWHQPLTKFPLSQMS